MAIGNQTLINMIKDVQHRLRRFSTGGLKQLLAKRADRAVARRSRRRGWPPVGVARGCPLGVFCELNVDNFRPFLGGLNLQKCMISCGRKGTALFIR